MLVLVCDDMETDRMALKKVLADMGHMVELASDGEDAIKKARANKPAVIFLDVVMPNQDGFATCRRLKTEDDTKLIPVVMVTSKATASDRFWAQKQGASGHIAKPFAPADVKAALTTLGL
jgi:twitching motility two-component system response regulator PilH